MVRSLLPALVYIRLSVLSAQCSESVLSTQYSVLCGHIVRPNLLNHWSIIAT